MRYGAVTAILLSTLALLVPTACGSNGAATGFVPDDGDGSVDAGGPIDPDTGVPVTLDADVPTDGAAHEAAPGSVTCTGKTGALGDRSVTLKVDGLDRTFDLHVPPGYVATKGTSLVFLFHGYTMTAAQIATTTHFSTVADARGMILAVPTGIGTSFNAGGCCGQAMTQNIDDVAFTKAMIASVEADYCVDPKRVFSTGFSNGGFFSYYLACELADQIAAIAPVSGGLQIDAASCKPKRPVPLLHIHGTGDVVVPYNGGGLGAAQPVSASIDAFKTKNGCAAGAGKVVYTKDDVSCTTWSGCTAGADVELCTVTGGGHQWPGGDALPYGGSPSPNLDSSAAIADFFEAHPRP